jgi:hypothetical protein
MESRINVSTISACSRLVQGVKSAVDCNLEALPLFREVCSVTGMPPRRSAPVYLKVAKCSRTFVGTVTLFCRLSSMEGPLIFIATLVTSTLGILAALYSIARDAKPHRSGARHRGVRFWNFR